MILGGTEARKEVLGALANIREGTDVRGSIGEAVGQNVGGDDYGCPRGPQFLDGFKECRPCLGLEGNVRFLLCLCSLCRRGIGANSLKNRPPAIEDESRDSEALSFQRSAFEVIGVRTRL